jgi:chaperone BCS1
MDFLWDFLQKQLAENNFFSGGLILMLAGGAVAYFREVPGQIWSWVKSRIVIEVDILDRDAAFDWLDDWLSRHPYAQDKARWLSVRTKAVDYRDRQHNPTGDHRPRILFTPAPGEHWLFYRGRLVVLTRERPKMNQQTAQPVNVRESFHLQIFTRDRKLVQQLLEDARDAALPPGDCRVTVYRNSYTSWSESLQRSPRPPESVVLRAGVMEGLIADSRKFLEQRQWYIERGHSVSPRLFAVGTTGNGQKLGGGGDRLGFEDGYRHSQPGRFVAG